MKKLLLMLAVSGTVVAMETSEEVQESSRRKTTIIKKTSDVGIELNALRARQTALHVLIAKKLSGVIIRSRTKREVEEGIQRLLAFERDISVLERQRDQELLTRGRSESSVGRTGSDLLYTLPPAISPTAPKDGNNI